MFVAASCARGFLFAHRFFINDMPRADDPRSHRWAGCGLANGQSGHGSASQLSAKPATNARGQAETTSAGYYTLPLLSPGLYTVRITADQYQSQEVHELELPVAGRIDLNSRLRPLNDIWEQGRYRSVFFPETEAVLTFYGPDVDTSRIGSFAANAGSRGTLEATVSRAIDPVELRALPFAGRDVYTMLVTQAGVTADTTTARGLGLSINGQRPSASNFMLDGLENNNYLVTGPLSALAPEAVQEYRVSFSSFSSEYGRTSGYLANAVTRSGGNRMARNWLLQSEERSAPCERFSKQQARTRAAAQQGISTGLPRRRTAAARLAFLLLGV